METKSKLKISMAGMTADKKGRPLCIPNDVIMFLHTILAPKPLKHTASHADFIKEAVRAELLMDIKRCATKRSY